MVFVLQMFSFTEQLAEGKSNLKPTLFVCHSHILRTLYPVNFTLGRFVAEDPRERSVKFGEVRSSRGACHQSSTHKESRSHTSSGACGNLLRKDLV